MKDVKSRIKSLFQSKTEIILIFLMLLFLFVFLVSENFYILSIAILSGFIAFMINEDRCENCKKLFTKFYAGKEYIETKLQPHKFRFETRYLYSNGAYKNSSYSEEQAREERVEYYRHIYKCKSCGHCTYSYSTKNLDINTRPNLVKEVIKTTIKEPKECVVCGRPLRTRRKYCFKCRPYGKQLPYEYYDEY